MGLLDTGAMKLLFGGAQYMKDRETERRTGLLSDALNPLIGNTQGPDSGGRHAPVPGRGLLGGQITPDQFYQQALGAVAGVPGMAPAVGTMLNTGLAGAGQAQRDATGREWSKNNITAAQQAQLDQNKQQTQYAQQIAQGNKQMDYGYKEMDYAQKLHNQYQPGIDMAGQALANAADDNGVIKWENTTGADQHAIVTSFAKSLLGEEAVNADDRGMIQQSGGYSGFFNNLIGMAKGGNLGAEVFYGIVESLQQNTQGAQRRYGEERERIYQRMSGLNLNPSQWMNTSSNPVPEYTLGGRGRTMGDPLGWMLKDDKQFNQSTYDEVESQFQQQQDFENPSLFKPVFE